MKIQNQNDLRNLDDKLDLTGLVSYLGHDIANIGGFADVWEGTFEGKTVAVKVIREVGVSRSTLTRRLVRETRAWAKLHHPNVLPLLGFTYGFGAGQLASLVSPWMPNGTAVAYLKDQPISEHFRVIGGVAKGLSYLHECHIVHGDLKGANILVDGLGEPRLADFGLSKLITEVSNTSVDSHVTRTSVLGSLRWMAPELFGDSDHHLGVTFSSDVWAYAMVVLELFTCLPPYYYVKNDMAVMLKVHMGEKPQYPSIPCGFNEGLWALCVDCWNVASALRPSMKTITNRVRELELRYTLRSHKRRMSEADLTEKSLYSVDVTASERLRKRPRLTVDLKSKIRCSSEPPIATSTLQPVINSAILTTPRFEPLDQSGEDDIAVQTKAHPSAVELQTHGPKSPGPQTPVRKSFAIRR